MITVYLGGNQWSKFKEFKENQSLLNAPTFNGHWQWEIFVLVIKALELILHVHSAHRNVKDDI